MRKAGEVFELAARRHDRTMLREGLEAVLTIISTTAGVACSAEGIWSSAPTWTIKLHLTLVISFLRAGLRVVNLVLRETGLSRIVQSQEHSLDEER